METQKLKSVIIDVEKGIYEVNGKSIASGCSELTLEFKEGKWSLALTEDSIYSTSESVIKGWSIPAEIMRGKRINIMRFYESQPLERIGFDFYCDIAGRMAEARKRKGWTQEMLAEKSGVTLSRIVKMENIKIRFYLKDIEKLAGILDITLNWLIDAKIDSQIDECLYLVWPESAPDFKLYQKATSKRMAFLLFDKRFKEAGVAYSSSRERFFVELVGVPITKAEIRDRFPKLTSDEEPIEQRGGQACRDGEGRSIEYDGFGISVNQGNRETGNSSGNDSGRTA